MCWFISRTSNGEELKRSDALADAYVLAATAAGAVHAGLICHEWASASPRCCMCGGGAMPAVVDTARPANGAHGSIDGGGDAEENGCSSGQPGTRREETGRVVVVVVNVDGDHGAGDRTDWRVAGLPRGRREHLLLQTSLEHVAGVTCRLATSKPEPARQKGAPPLPHRRAGEARAMRGQENKGVDAAEAWRTPCCCFTYEQVARCAPATGRLSQLASRGRVEWIAPPCLASLCSCWRRSRRSACEEIIAGEASSEAGGRPSTRRATAASSAMRCHAQASVCVRNGETHAPEGVGRRWLV